MLARAEPESMVDFRQNAARYTGELDNLDGSLFRQIEHWPWRTILSTDRFLFPFARHHGLSIAIFGAPVRRGGPPLAQPLFVDALTAREVRSVELSGRQMVLLDPLGKSDYIDLMQTMVQSMTSAMEAHEK
jgi:hypothetical protein